MDSSVIKAAHQLIKNMIAIQSKNPTKETHKL